MSSKSKANKAQAKKLKSILKSVGVNVSTSQISSAQKSLSSSSSSSSSSKSSSSTPAATTPLYGDAARVRDMAIAMGATPERAESSVRTVLAQSSSPTKPLTYAPGSLETMTVAQAKAAGRYDEYMGIVNSFPKAPTNVNAITPISTPTVPPAPIYNPNIAPAVAANMGNLASVDTRMLQDQEAQKIRLEQRKLEKQQEANRGTFDKLLNGTPDSAEIRNDALDQSGNNATEYFADQKKRIMEIDSLTQDYNAMVAARDAEIVQAQGRLAPMSFINNQVNQIRNAASIPLAEKSANINSKAATMEALQGNFSQALTFANLAVDDAVSTYKLKVDSAKMFYDMNEDQIDRLDKKYSEALDAKTRQYELEYKAALADKEFVRDIFMKNPASGINIATDTVESATRKYTAAGGSIQDIANMKEINKDGAVNETAATSYIQKNIDAGLSVMDSVDSVVKYYQNELGINVTDKMINDWTKKAKTLTKSPEQIQFNYAGGGDSVSGGEVGREATTSFWGNLFGQ
jgi:hypothetical protein